jgi:GntR family transcriptional regulator/MocR family aminotransferase
MAANHSGIVELRNNGGTPAIPTAAVDLPLAIAAMHVNPESPVPLYEQICTALRNAIVAGDLPSGTAIPTSRELAAAMRVGRNTVVTAYSRLVAEGYLVSNRRRGTHVTKDLVGAQIFGTDSRRGGDNDRDSVSSGKIEISFRAQQALSEPCASGSPGGPFALHAPDPSLFPRNQLGRLLNEEFSRSPGADGNQACRRFQTALSVYLRLKRGVCCEPSQIIPVTGIECALDLTARVMLDPGHCALVEDPALPAARRAFAMAGARVIALPSDTSGADPSRVCAPPPRLIFVSPSVSFPIGRQMIEERRLALLEFARVSGSIIFEADSYWELSYQNERLRALHGRDRFGQVIYFGGMTETLGPFIRAAYLVVPPDLVEPFWETAKRVGYGPDAFVLAAIARYLEDSQYAVHVRAIRALYAQRMIAFVQALRSHLRGATVLEPSGGVHVTLLLPERTDELAISRLAAAHGIAVAPLSSFYQAKPQSKGIVLGFGLIAERNIDLLVRRFCELLDNSDEIRPMAELARA